MAWKKKRDLEREANTKRGRSKLRTKRLAMSLGETDGVLYGNVEYEGYQADEVERRF